MSAARWFPRPLFGLLSSLLLLPLVGAACSDDAGDAVEQACRVVVEDCGVVPSMSACLDYVGGLTSSCIQCIAESGCPSGGGSATEPTNGYASCERVPGCRIPGVLLPEAD
jgi:hypothetical protein